MPSFNKGDAIRFIRGDYEGLTGWMDKDKKKKKKGVCHCVIVDLGDDESNQLKKAKALPTSFRKVFEAPTCYEEAAIQQHPKLEKKMAELAEMWAQFHVRDEKKIIELFGKELAAARKNQKKKGPAANHKCVDCTSPINGAKRNSSTVDNNRMRTDG